MTNVGDDLSIRGQFSTVFATGVDECGGKRWQEKWVFYLVG